VANVFDDEQAVNRQTQHVGKSLEIGNY